MEEWEDLGEKLQLPYHKLREIGVGLAYRGPSRQKSEMVDLWLRHDLNPTWEKLCIALEQMNGMP